MKKIFMRITSMMMALVMTLGLCAVSFADTSDYTIKVKNSIGGITYSAYKVFDAQYNGDAVSYTIDSDSPWYDAVIAAETIFTLTEYSRTGDGDDVVVTYHVEVKEVSDEDVISFLNATYALLKDDLEAAGSGLGNGHDLELEIDDPGYYYVTTSVGTAVSVTTAAPQGVIIDKNQKPGEGGKDPEDEGWDTGFTKDADDTSYSIGDDVEYSIRSYVPTYDQTDEVISYTITDTMGKGLTLQASMTDNNDGTYTVTDGVKVEIAGTGIDYDDVNKTYYEDITDACTITVTYDNNETILTVYWEIKKILENDLVYPADAVVRITYIDKVNEEADDADMTNQVALKWTKLTPGGEEEDKGNDTPEVTVYTYGFDFIKTDGENPLDGAQFSLKKEGSDENIRFIYDEGSNTYEEWDGVKAAETTDIITVSGGKVKIWGLKAGTYTLTEVIAPSGYNMLQEPVTIVIADDYGGWTVTVDDGQPSTGTFSNTDEHGVETMPNVTVVNSAGGTLPGTGGVGTTIFYMVGTLLVLSAAALVIAKRRLDKTE